MGRICMAALNKEALRRRRNKDMIAVGGKTNFLLIASIDLLPV
jgi:hypothetical protein